MITASRVRLLRTPPRCYRLLKHITLVVSTNEIARRVLATEPKRSIICCRIHCRLSMYPYHLLPPFLYTSHVRTTRVRTHDVTGYNLTLTSGTRRVRTQHDVTPLFSTPYHVTSGPRWGGGVILLISLFQYRFQFRF